MLHFPADLITFTLMEKLSFECSLLKILVFRCTDEKIYELLSKFLPEKHDFLAMV